MPDAERPSRVEALSSWHSDWSGLRVAVLGLGVTGFSAADTLIELGADVMVFSTSHDERRGELLEIIGGRLVERDLSSDETDDLQGFDPELVIVSPGFAPDHPLVRWAGDAGIPLWGDVELAWRLRDKVGAPADWIVVTGAHDRSMAAQLVEGMMLSGGLRVLSCGSAAVPVLDAIRDPLGWDVLVLELSSFQLHYVDSISPWASACLGVEGIHPEWHGSVADYITASAKAYENTQVACIYDRADPVALAMVEQADVVEGCRAVSFGLDIPGPSDFGIVEGILCDRAFIDDRLVAALELTTLAELADAGVRTPETVAIVLAAAALARSYGIPAAAVREALALPPSEPDS